MIGKKKERYDIELENKKKQKKLCSQCFIPVVQEWNDRYDAPLCSSCKEDEL